MGFDRDVLLEAGIERADAFAAVSSGDNSNIISARVARETFGVERVVARIYDAKRAAVYERLGIPTVATVPWTTDRLMRMLLPDGVAAAWRDPSGTVAVLPAAAARGLGRPPVASWSRRPAAGWRSSSGSGRACCPTPTPWCRPTTRCTSPRSPAPSPMSTAAAIGAATGGRDRCAWPSPERARWAGPSRWSCSSSATR